MAYSDALRQQYATFTTAADLIDGLLGAVQAGTFSSISIKSTGTFTQTNTKFSNDADPHVLTIQKSRGAAVDTNTIVQNGDAVGRIEFRGANGTTYDPCARIQAFIDAAPGASNDMPGGLLFSTTANGSATSTERMRINSDGNVMIGTTTYALISGNTVGVALGKTGDVSATADGAAPAYFNRKTNDGALVNFYQDGTLEGSISVAGNTVTYGAFCGSHWAQMEDGSKPDIKIGTILESVSALCAWDDEINLRLPKVKISGTVKSRAVYGVFMAWDNDWTETNDLNVASLGAYFCRVAAGTVLQIGDYLESAGNGYAQVQADDILRASTIGKVIATAPAYIESDGSFCIPTTLHCG